MSALRVYDAWAALAAAGGGPAKPAKVANEESAFEPVPPAKLAKPANAETAPDGFEERAAIIEDGADVPRAWAEGYAKLCTMPRPTDFTVERWQRLVDDAGRFLDDWGRQAAGLGWHAVDVFGVSPHAPDARLDQAGLVALIRGERVVAITAETATIRTSRGQPQTYRRKPMAEAVVVWELEKG